MLRVLLQPVQRAVQAVLTGGRAGQILRKRSDADNDVEWVDAPTGTIIVDNSLDTTSANAISNKAVAECLTWQELN